MPAFIVRIELHDADPDDYVLLHAEMMKQGFSRRIKGSDGVFYKLPDAEYIMSADISRDEVLEKPKQPRMKQVKNMAYW